MIKKNILENSAISENFKKKVRKSFIHGEFKDFTGATRHVCIAAITTTLVSKSKEFKYKVINLGVAVQSPHDLGNVDTDLAETIAAGKALSYKTTLSDILLAGNDCNIFGQRVINEILLQELDYFRGNPGKYIKGYESDKKLYEASPKEYFAKYEING